MARCLIDAGHRHLLIFGLNEVPKNVRTRVSAFKAEAVCPEMAVDTVLVEGSMEDLRAALAKYLAHNRPTVVFSLAQKGTLTVLSEFRRRGFQCPQDISLVGFDDAEWMQAAYPSVSAVVQPVAHICNTMLERNPVALITAAINSTNLPPCLSAAQAAGIKVVDLDGNLDPEILAAEGIDITFRIGSDNVVAGAQGADYMVSQLGADATVPFWLSKGFRAILPDKNAPPALPIASPKLRRGLKLWPRCRAIGTVAKRPLSPMIF